MRKIARLFRQWRESWAEAAYDDVREEIRRLQVVQLRQTTEIAQLRAQVKKATEKAQV